MKAVGTPTDRRGAGRKARRHGVNAEYEYMKSLAKSGRTAIRVRNQPFDLIAWDDEGFIFSQVKSYLLLPSEMREAKSLLQEVIVPPNVVKEVAQYRRRRGCRKMKGTKKWEIEVVKEG